MRLPSFSRIDKKDFSDDDQDLISKLSVTINQSFEALYSAFNNKVALRDNLQCTVKDVEVLVDSTGKPTTTTGMSLDLSGKVDGLMVIRADNLANAAVFPSGQPFISFTVTDTNVIFSNITGLQAGNKYRLRIVAFQS